MQYLQGYVLLIYILNNFMKTNCKEMDFSEVECSGFILRYIEFWTLCPEDKCTPITLHEVSEGLLKGCQEHY